MGILNLLFGNFKISSSSQKQHKHSLKIKMYYHVFKHDKALRPVCTFQSKRKAYSFARRISVQNHMRARIIVNEDITYLTEEEKQQELLDEYYQRL